MILFFFLQQYLIYICNCYVFLGEGYTQSAGYGTYDGRGLSAQISMKLSLPVIDTEPKFVRCLATNPLSGEMLKSRVAVLETEVSNMVRLDLASVAEGVPL